MGQPHTQGAHGRFPHRHPYGDARSSCQAHHSCSPEEVNPSSAPRYDWGVSLPLLRQQDPDRCRAPIPVSSRCFEARADLSGLQRGPPEACPSPDSAISRRVIAQRPRSCRRALSSGLPRAGGAGVGLQRGHGGGAARPGLRRYIVHGGRRAVQKLVQRPSESGTSSVLQRREVKCIDSSDVY